jgi:hypothetical protein
LREIITNGGNGPQEYEPVARAWDEMKTLPKLAVLRDNDKYEENHAKFLVYLDDASEKLRKKDAP